MVRHAFLWPTVPLLPQIYVSEVGILAGKDLIFVMLFTKRRLHKQTIAGGGGGGGGRNVAREQDRLLHLGNTLAHDLKHD